MYSGPEDIYEELVEKSDDNWLLGLVAFAVVEEQKIEWINHQKNINGKSPSDAEIRNWYAQQPEGVLLRATDTAESRLKDYSDEVLELVLAEYKEEIAQGIIVNEINELKQFWPQFGINVAGGVVGALIFSALLILISFIALNDTFAQKVEQKINNNSEASNVKEQ